MKRSLIWVATLLALPLTVHADDTEKKPDTQAVTVLPSYVLGPEDAISINVINFANLSLPQVVIPPDGKITVPLLEPFSVIGKTTMEVAEILTQKWRKYVINPSITVTLVQKRRENVLIYGFIGRTGTIEYKVGKRILEVLAEVGGPTAQSDLEHVVVTRKDGTKQTLDLSHPERKGGTEIDIVLQVGDIIYIPEKRTQFSVVGEVNRAGSFDYKEDMTVLDALTIVGGIRMETADLAGATLLHDGTEEKLDLEALLKRGDFSINRKLGPGDRIMIPEIRNRVYVFGSVGRPGYYLFKPQDRVLDALNGMGGPMREANLGRITHIRIDRTTNKSNVKFLNVDKFLKKGDQEGNVLLEPGDVIYIADKKRGFQIQDLWSVFSGVQVINGLGNLFGFSRR